MLLIVGEPQIGRTAMALMLSGRMKPKSGTVTWNGHSSMGRLRKVSAVVDSPNINEPEAHLKIRDIVSEDLSLIPSPPWRKPNPKKWMQDHGFSDIAHEWTDAVEPVRMTEMLTQLAAENRQTKLLVVDSPDRHQEDDEGWLRNLERFALDERQFAVIALVGRPPAEWEGPIMYLGEQAQAQELDEQQTEEEPQTTSQPALPLAEETAQAPAQESAADTGNQDAAQPAAAEPLEEQLDAEPQEPAVQAPAAQAPAASADEAPEGEAPAAPEAKPGPVPAASPGAETQTAAETQAEDDLQAEPAADETAGKDAGTQAASTETADRSEPKD